MVLRSNWPQYFERTIKIKRLEKWRSQNKDLYKILHFSSTMPRRPENEGHTIRICTKFYIFIQPCLYVRLKNEGHAVRICTKYYTFIPPFLYARLKNEGPHIRIHTKYYTSITSCLYPRLKNEGHKINATC